MSGGAIMGDGFASREAADRLDKNVVVLLIDRGTCVSHVGAKRVPL